MLDGLFEYFFEHYSILNDKQRKKIKGLTTVFLVFGFCVLFGFVSMMMSHRDTEKARWEKNLSGVELYKADMLPISQNATKVLTGTYVETIDNLDMAHGNYWVKFLVWFRWDGDEISDLAHNFRIYRGIIKNRDIVKDVKQDNTHYQLVRVDAIVSSSFHSELFPLESHQLYFYVEPNYTAKRVVLVADKEESNLNRHFSVEGFKVTQSAVASVPYEYRSTRGDITLKDVDKNIVSELVTAIKIERDGFGLYAKCFICLFGCIIWALLALYINIYHHVDPLELLPEALFGCIANIMVGASLLPEALEMGLLEYVNIWGLFIILMIALIIINVNQIRKEERTGGGISWFAAIYGRIMFFTITFFAIAGNIILPASAYFSR